MRRRLLGLAAAVLVAGALVAPIVLRGGQSRPHGSSCTATVRFRHRLYERREPPQTPETQHTAIGIGVLSGCGQAPANVNVRSLSGVRPARAVGIEGDTGLYVREGVCTGLDAARLLRCLRR